MVEFLEEKQKKGKKKGKRKEEKERSVAGTRIDE